MGLIRRVAIYKVGEHVSARKNSNAVSKYFPGEIVAVHERPSVGETHWNAEKSIALHLLVNLLTCYAFHTPKLLYDVKYEDGTTDVELSPEYIRKLSQPPQQP